MKKLIIAWMFIFASLQISSLAFAGEYDDLEQYGFRLVEDSGTKLHIQFLRQMSTSIILSKQKFKTSYEAEQFCMSQNLPIFKGLLIPLMLAMSGVSTNHPFIQDAIAFDFSNYPGHLPDREYQTGIWAWSRSGEDAIDLEIDGRNIGDKMSVSDINAALNTEVALPAICSNFKMRQVIH